MEDWFDTIRLEVQRAYRINGHIYINKLSKLIDDGKMSEAITYYKSLIN